MNEETKTITFDNETYRADDLSDKAKAAFNDMLSVQEKWRGENFVAEVTKLALETLSNGFKNILEDEKAEPIKDEPEIITQTKEIN